MLVGKFGKSKVMISTGTLSSILTKIKSDRPDMVVKDYENMPTDRGISVTEYDKISKYKDLT